jgi:hypothetical protein
VESERGESEGGGERWIEAGEFEFFVEGADDGEVEEEDGAIDPEGSWAQRAVARVEGIPWGVGDFAVEDAVEIEVDLAGITADQNDAEREERGEDDADGCVGIEAPAILEAFDQEDGENAKQACTDDHGEWGATAGEEEGQDDAWEDGMADGVAEERHASEDKERSDEGATGGDERTCEKNDEGRAHGLLGRGMERP